MIKILYNSYHLPSLMYFITTKRKEKKTTQNFYKTSFWLLGHCAGRNLLIFRINNCISKTGSLHVNTQVANKDHRGSIVGPN